MLSDNTFAQTIPNKKDLLNSREAREIRENIERKRDQSRNTNNDNRTTSAERRTTAERRADTRSAAEIANANDIRQYEAERKAEIIAAEKAKRELLVDVSHLIATKLKGVDRPNTSSKKEKSKIQEVTEFVLFAVKQQIAYGNAVSDPIRKEVANYIEKNVLPDFGLPAEYNKKISNTIAKKLIGNNKIEKLLIPKSIRPTTTFLKAGVSLQAIDNGNWTASNVTELCDKITENIILYMSGDISIEQYKENTDKLISSFKKSFAKQIAKNYKLR
jgi:hypothetical protein